MKRNSCDSCCLLVGELGCEATRQPATFEPDCPHYKPMIGEQQLTEPPRPIPFTRAEWQVVNRYLEGVQHGDETMIWELVQLYWAHNYLQEAIDWCETIYRPGDAATAGSLATLYTSLHEDATAFRWLVQAYEDGAEELAYAIAECYENGTGTEQNEELAIVWYLKAAHGSTSDYEAIARLKELGVDARNLQGTPYPGLASPEEQRKSLSPKNEVRNLLIVIAVLTMLFIWYLATH